MRSLGGMHRGFRQSGVGLIEVLIAVLVLSIGFLGMAALMAKSMATNNSAMARSMATISSYSILDALRADIVAARAGTYNGKVTADSCPAAGGSLSSFQLNRWCKELGNALGAQSTTSGEVACTGAGECTVTITFDDSRAGAGGAADQKVITKAIL
ncbi:type IV pilus modification protein PilV [Dyella ginsengisoli]|uniref:Type IV pilus modification protein PilV n=2 Tax=Dyella ginsengisoli TaxID=363848 RepID=A0ABW8JWU8_9GAMM